MGAMSRERFDVCVIGSGAAGGTLASQLVKRGARVALIEAGKYRDPSKLRNHAWPYDQARPPTIPSVTPDPKREPVEYKGDPISVSRGRVVGGRTTHWNAVTLRFSEDDFREWSMNSIEEDWPLTYRELAPYYDQAEELMVVCGTRENLEVVPDGRFIRPLRMRCSENILDRACRRIGMRVIPVRKALATEPGHGRSACHYCGHCMQGCGRDFKRAVKRRYPALIQLHPYGEVLPRATNRIRVDGHPDGPLRAAYTSYRVRHRRERAQDARKDVRHGRGDPP